ncbi:hypothetical protein PUN28_008029 [Cardiocondyla obscurior]|uniref:Uncharacterized protein n=1 Tax=Cardiocondyla obscurior TaxID=286306 RepID=A0AAW2G1Q0_9HYME
MIKHRKRAPQISSRHKILSAKLSRSCSRRHSWEDLTQHLTKTWLIFCFLFLFAVVACIFHRFNIVPTLEFRRYEEIIR